jgi:hypothetical protein
MKVPGIPPLSCVRDKQRERKGDSIGPWPYEEAFKQSWNQDLRTGSDRT